MNLKSVLKFLIILWCLAIPSNSKPKTKSQQPKKACSTPSILTFSRPTLNFTSLTKATVQVMKYPVEVEVLYFKRSRLSIYCTSEFEPFTTGSCTETIANVTATADEVRNWHHEGLCPTGIECEPEGECWGKRADACKSLETQTPIGPYSLKWKGRRWKKLIRDTCIQSWACSLHSILSPIGLKWTPDRNTPTPYFKDYNNREIEMSDDLFKYGIKTALGEMYTLKDNPQNPVTSESPANCFATDEKDIKCIIQEISETQNIPIDLTDGYDTLLRNYHITLVSPINIMKDGKAAVYTPAKNKHHHGTMEEDKLHLQNPASLEDVRDLSMAVYTLQLQTLYNIQAVDQNLRRTQEVINQLIYSSSEDDPRLLARLIGREMFTTEWITDKIFKICPSKQLYSPEDSNCDAEHMFKLKGPVKRTNSIGCTKITSSNMQKINIYATTQYDLEELSQLPLQGAPMDNEEWTKFKEEITSEAEDSSSKHTEGKEATLYENLGLSFIDKWLTTFLAVGSILSYLHVGFIIIRGRG